MGILKWCFRFIEVVEMAGAGSFDSFEPDVWLRDVNSAPAGSDSPVASDPPGPTSLEARCDQLGLKLEFTKGAIPVLVVDKVERPSNWTPRLTR